VKTDGMTKFVFLSLTPHKNKNHAFKILKNI